MREPEWSAPAGAEETPVPEPTPLPRASIRPAGGSNPPLTALTAKQCDDESGRAADGAFVGVAPDF